MTPNPIPSRPQWEQPEHVAGDDLAPWTPKVYQSYMLQKPWGIQGWPGRWFIVHDPETKPHKGPYKDVLYAMTEAEKL